LCKYAPPAFGVDNGDGKGSFPDPAFPLSMRAGLVFLAGFGSRGIDFVFRDLFDFDFAGHFLKIPASMLISWMLIPAPPTMNMTTK
jgi:hypothetical protein